MLAEYFPILLFILVGTAVGAVPPLLAKLLGPSRPDPRSSRRTSAGSRRSRTRMKFDVRYYLVAILFILFDLEIAFLFPWAAVINDIGFAGFISMMVFLAILTVGFIYEWMKGARMGIAGAYRSRVSSPRPSTRSSTGRAPDRYGR